MKNNCEDYKTCLKCEYCSDDDAGLYCDLPKCKYDFTFINFLQNLLNIFINFIEIIAVGGLAVLGISATLVFFDLKWKYLILGLLMFIPIYGIWWLIDWRRNK